jgi:Transglutaminase-like superfamily
MNVITPRDLDRLPPVRRSRLGLEVLMTYLRVRWLMRGDDPRRAVHALRASAAGSGMSFDEEAGTELVAAWRLARAVRKVLSRLPGDSRCLFSSLTLMCMLERRGITQMLVIAVRPAPFAAHAWVEVGGQAMLPDADPGYERLLEL